jgi:hypothetical protein
MMKGETSPKPCSLAKPVGRWPRYDRPRSHSGQEGFNQNIGLRSRSTRFIKCDLLDARSGSDAHEREVIAKNRRRLLLVQFHCDRE